MRERERERLRSEERVVGDKSERDEQSSGPNPETNSGHIGPNPETNSGHIEMVSVDPDGIYFFTAISRTKVHAMSERVRARGVFSVFTIMRSHVPLNLLSQFQVTQLTYS
ncbi:hypothetical protein Ddye_031167 [Dipteronia dyeriana]|uniref:Uncharacterized protein n=1 Tax=Dipteronia dyeriana TaxID=168575 RepID=A0AAD9WNE3_9ROSI|nr:hypothetical protein Ddye_031167 [Dipteronia dyeriana]